MDLYDRQARMLPAGLTIAIPVLAVWGGTLVGGGLDLGSTAGAVMATAGGISAAIAIGGNYVGKKGKMKEKEIWKALGGFPTHRMIRHDSKELDATAKQRLHQGLMQVGYEVPTPGMEQEEPEKAKELWSIAIAGIREEVGEDPRVAGKNRQYGFIRNTWGMKGVSITLSIAVILTGLGMVMIEAFDDTQIGWTVAGFGMAGVVAWCLGAQEKHTVQAGEDFARTLLECASAHRWDK